METIIMEIDILIQILSGLIVAAIVGAFTFSLILYKCVHRQAIDLKLMKKATGFVLSRMVQETKALHPEAKGEIEDLEKIYKDLIND